MPNQLYGLTDSFIDVATAVEDLLSAHASSLGLYAVSFGDLTRAVNGGFPCCWIMPGELKREFTGSSLEVALDFRLLIYVMHADMTVDRRDRTYADLELSAAVRDLLHQDISFSGILAGSIVESETPSAVPYMKGKIAKRVISTQLIWNGVSRGTLG